MSCDYCGKLKKHFTHEFNVKTYGKFYSCSKCVKKVKLNLVYETPHKFPCIVIDPDDKQNNHVFGSVDQLEGMIKKKHRLDFRYGFYRDKQWKTRCRAAWLGMGDFGSMNDKDLEAEITRGLQSFVYLFTVGWRGYQNTGPGGNSKYLVLENRIGVENTVDRIMERIREFETENHLAGTPRLLIHTGPSPYNINDLDEFCSFGTPDRIVMFDTIESLREALYSRKYGHRDEELTIRSDMAFEIADNLEKRQSELVLMKKKIESVLTPCT